MCYSEKVEALIRNARAGGSIPSCGTTLRSTQEEARFPGGPPPPALRACEAELDAERCVQKGIIAPTPDVTVERPMTITAVMVQPLMALIAGILILIIPRLLNYIVAIYLIIIGLAGLLPYLAPAAHS